MLTLRQADSIVHNTLLIFKGFEIDRREEVTNIFYDVHDNPETGRRFLGTYRVWEWHDGSGRSSWMPFDTNDAEITRLRHGVWEAIMATAVPANLSNNYDAPMAQQPASVDQGAGLGFTTHQEDIYLVCDKREFRAWFERQYPTHAKHYRDTPEGAIFSINLIQFTFAYLPDNGRYKYSFAVIEPTGYAKIREEFIGTVRNTFEVIHATLVSGGAVNEDLFQLMPKDQKTKDHFRKAWGIWNKMVKEYKKDVLDQASNKAKPKIQDLRTRVIREMNWKVSERRLQTVIQLGEAKLIK